MKRSIHSGASVKRRTNEVIRGLLFRFLLTLCVLLVDLLGRNGPARVFLTIRWPVNCYFDTVDKVRSANQEECRLTTISENSFIRFSPLNNNSDYYSACEERLRSSKIVLKKLLYFSRRQKEKKVLTRNCIHESFNENNNNKLHVAQRLKTIITIAARNSFLARSLSRMQANFFVPLNSSASIPCQCWLLFLYFLHFSELLSLRLGRRCWCGRRRDKFSLNKMLFSRFSPSIEVAQLKSRRVVVCFSLLCLASPWFIFSWFFHWSQSSWNREREEENKIAHASDHQVMCFVLMVSGWTEPNKYVLFFLSFFILARVLRRSSAYFVQNSNYIPT